MLTDVIVRLAALPSYCWRKAMPNVWIGAWPLLPIKRPRRNWDEQKGKH